MGREELRDLRHNLLELLELDYQFGVQFLPRPVTDPTTPKAIARPAAPAARPAAKPAATSRAPRRPASETPPLPPLPTTGSSEEILAAVATAVAECRRCRLHEQRSRTVPGEGHPHPELLFIGEGPGQEEDQQGRPFVGPAGQLLDRMITAMGFKREEVFIANVVKCRPPGNRAPDDDEAAACLAYLECQVDALKPKVICSLGATPLKALTGDPRAGITRVRGKAFTWRGYTVIPTFHPSYLLRNPGAKKPCWEDLKVVLTFLGRLPAKG